MLSIPFADAPGFVRHDQRPRQRLLAGLPPIPPKHPDRRPRAPLDSGYPLGLEPASGTPSRIVVRRLFPDTRVTAFRLAA